jgi:hypothetical protein
VTISRLSAVPINTEGNFLVDGLIPAADLTVLWGPPKCGKTFWAIDLAMHVASGLSYRGRKVKQGPVVYCSLEGNHEFAARAHAAANVLSLKDPDFFLYRDRLVFTKLSQSHGLTEEIRKLSIIPVLVVIDTLNKSLDGSENSDEDMTHYTRCVEGIFREFGCSVMILHHCGKAADKPRGHTSLTGTCAAQLKMMRSGKSTNPMLVSTIIEFMKDGAEGAEMFSWIKQTTVGYADDDTPIHTCYIQDAPHPSDDDEVTSTFMTPQTRKARSVLENLLEHSVEDRVTLTAWKTACEAHGISRTKNGFKKAWERALVMLKESGVIHIEGQWVRLGSDK